MHSTPQIEKTSTVGDPGPATTAKAPDFRLKKLEERPGGFGPSGLCASGTVFNDGDELGPFGLCAGTVFNDQDEES